VKGSLAANLAIAFALVGGPLFLKIIGEMGDPWPPLSAEEVARARFYDLICFFSGVTLLVASLWLSGYAFSSARWRSLLALLLSVASIFTLVLI